MIPPHIPVAELGLGQPERATWGLSTVGEGWTCSPSSKLGPAPGRGREGMGPAPAPSPLRHRSQCPGGQTQSLWVGWRFLGTQWDSWVSVPCISENTWKPVTLAGAGRSCLGLEVERIKYPKQDSLPVMCHRRSRPCPETCSCPARCLLGGAEG